MTGEQDGLNANSGTFADREKSPGLSDAWPPIKTPEGRAEIGRRSRNLSQRQRTVLFLVDGQRTVSQVRRAAVQIGASETCLDELLTMGLVIVRPSPAAESERAALSAPERATALRRASAVGPTEAAPTDVMEYEPLPNDVHHAAANPVEQDRYGRRLPPLLFDVYVPAKNRVPVAGVTTNFQSSASMNSSWNATPSSIRSSTVRRGGRIDSVISSLLPLLESAFGGLGGKHNVALTDDPAMEQARRILMREVRAKAPIFGALTVMKLRRAQTREELAALLSEAGTQIGRPMRSLSAQQILTHVRALLDRPM